VRGGWLYRDGRHADSGETRYIDSMVCDLGAPIVGYTGTFATAGSYMGIILCLDDNAWGGVGLAFHAVATGNEFAAAVGAEQDVMGMMDGSVSVYQDWMPLKAVILKNDGSVGTVGAILPIDGVNRGRSYLWIDLRPRHRLML